MSAPAMARAALREEYDRAETRRLAAAEDERAAFERWQDAFGAHEVAAEESAAAYRAYAAGDTN